MKVTRLDAKDVHGFLPIHIDFDEKLTFLTGLNGSGKTTALRLLMGLLAPNIDELIDISFANAHVTVADGEDQTIVTAERSVEGLRLSTSKFDGCLSLSTAELQLLVEARHRDEPRTPLHLKIYANEVFKSVKKLSTPMFLGLDRTLRLEESDGEHSSQMTRQSLMYRRSYPAGIQSRSVSDRVLSEVNQLVSHALSEIRAAQEHLDEDLRNQILLDSFRYEPSSKPLATPGRGALNSFRERQAAIEKAAAGLKLPAGALQSALSEFFEKVTQTVDALDEKHAPTKAVAKNAKGKKEIVVVSNHMIEWIMNSRQADRIFKQIQLLEEYAASRAKLHLPIDRFLELTNDFLRQTFKTVTVSDRGRLRVKMNGHESERSLSALSSGERQLVIMLAHLSLNPHLAKSGVFIVDEPELSLHLGWQEQFVDAIQRANPNVQLILATHSPAIILERIDQCRSLS